MTDPLLDAGDSASIRLAGGWIALGSSEWRRILLAVAPDVHDVAAVERPVEKRGVHDLSASICSRLIEGWKAKSKAESVFTYGGRLEHMAASTRRPLRSSIWAAMSRSIASAAVVPPPSTPASTPSSALQRAGHLEVGELGRGSAPCAMAASPDASRDPGVVGQRTTGSTSTNRASAASSSRSADGSGRSGDTGR